MIQAARTLDVGLCLNILTNHDIFSAISEDGATIEHLKVDVLGDYWVAIFKGDQVFGVAQFKQLYSKCFDCHIHILPEHRKHSNDAGAALLRWCKQNMPNSLLCAHVPVFCVNVIEFLKKFYFNEQGTLKNAWTKNGKQNDMKILTKEVK